MTTSTTTTSTTTTRRPKGSGALYTVTRNLWNPHSHTFQPTPLYQAAEDITNPLDPFTRKRVTGTGHTPQQAKLRLEKSKARFYRKIGLAQAGISTTSPQHSPTLNDYFDLWYSRLNPHRVSASKKLKYRGIFTNHILPELGKKQLAELTYDDLNTFIHTTLPNKTKNKHGQEDLSPSGFN